jgi:NADH-quinone oxidoreductase subunit L
MSHVHESPLMMLVPLFLLAGGALVSGFMLKEWFIGHHWADFWAGAIVNAPHNQIMHHMHEVPGWVPLAPTVVGLGGIALAYVLYVFAPGIPGQLANSFGGLYRFLLYKWYFDELYDRIFVRPALWLARFFWQVGDATLIDGMPNGAAAIAAGASRESVKLQTGSIAVYAFSMLIGVVALVSVFLVFR